ncbi:putative virion structural protein [Erwinia phage vB_EamM_ChrisDB]|uniref:putative virion structural protein n=1 Tax=Erwinia phage vB_EamM_ChrisDB TaxID=1883371 RepID=UPI00081C66B0|nr:putative virion structural protein [Erwinia phage vB_EamM_ChrisDB]ANZ48623.1 putative virion structural protein [Erwinia phage vB_EamM_ChrisDB]
MGYWSKHAQTVGELKLVAAESIKFQDKKKLAALAEIVAAFQAAGDYSLAAYDTSGVAEWVQDTVGVGIKLCTGHELGLEFELFAAVEPPQIDANNPIIADLQKTTYQGNKDLDLYTKFLKDNALNGEFDDSNAKLKGDLSKITSPLYVTPEIFKGRAELTAYEIAAIILHEVGHVYWYLRTLMRGVIVNLIADAAANRMMEMDSPQEKLRVVKDVERMLNTKINQPETICNDYKKENMYMHLVTQTLLLRPNITGGRATGNRVWERAADDFAARFGAAPHLASALYKMEMSNWWILRNNAYTNIYTHLFGELIEISGLVIAMTNPIGVVFSTISIMFGLLINDPGSTIYDPPQERFEALRRNLVEELNTLKGVNTKQAQENRDRCLKGIVQLDQILKNVKDKDNIYSFIMKNLTSYGRKEKAAVDYQRQLESYMSNDLRIASAKLQQLA